MDDCYLIAVCIQNQWYIKLAKQDSGHALAAYETIKEAVSVFSSFKEKMFSSEGGMSGYEKHISGSMGMFNCRPHVLAVPLDNPSILEQYITNKRPYSVKGQMIGLFVDFVGMKVTESILELSVVDVSSTYVNELYA